MDKKGLNTIGCLITLLPAFDIGPVEGTIMWLIFFLGIWLINLASSEQESTANQPQEILNCLFLYDIFRCGFQNEFSKNQKAAIISSLIIIAKVDGDVHQKETEFIDKTIRTLGIDQEDPIFHEFIKKGPDHTIFHLNSLSPRQKKWYIVAVHDLISCDGKIKESEANYAIGFCNKIGISDDKYMEVVEKSELLKQKFFG